MTLRLEENEMKSKVLLPREEGYSLESVSPMGKSEPRALRACRRAGSLPQPGRAGRQIDRGRRIAQGRRLPISIRINRPPYEAHVQKEDA